MNLEYFRERILPLKDKLYRFAYSYLKHTEESEDVVQEVFMKVWRKRDSMNKINNIDAWCMTLTRNMAIDRTRSGKFQLMELKNTDQSDNITPLSQVESRDMFDRIHDIINSLSDKQKQVILLRDIEGYSYKEISEMTGMDQNLVKVSLFRARDNVRKRILKTENYGL